MTVSVIARLPPARHPEAALAAEGSLDKRLTSRLPRRHQLRKRAGAVAHLVLLLGLHLAEGDQVPVRHEHRIVAKALLAARRPRQRALDLALEHVARALGR